MICSNHIMHINVSNYAPFTANHCYLINKMLFARAYISEFSLLEPKQNNDYPGKNSIALHTQGVHKWLAFCSKEWLQYMSSWR